MRTTAPFINRRRVATSAFALAGVLALSSCATFTRNSDAAVVNGKEIPRDRLEAFIDEFAANQQLPLADGIMQLDDARNLLAGMIKADAYTSFLREQGKPLTDTQRAAVREKLAAQNAGDLSKELEGVIIEVNAATEAINDLEAPADGKIEKLYAERPSLTGAMCASHLVVKKKETAEMVLSRLAKGAKFGDLAKKYSIEPAAKTSGGALQGQSEDGKTSPCMSILEYQQNFDPAFTRGAVAAQAGVPYGPVRSSFGWHVILLAPWDAVKDDVLSLVKAEPGPNLATGWLANADISVDPAYGRWDSATGTIAAS
ncbi:MAG: peptidylprolyl isomerase [Actinomycetota bacterium]